MDQRNPASNRRDPASLLDDPQGIAQLDRGGLLGLAAGFGEQLSQGLALGNRPEADPPTTDHAVFCGMGGSAAAGDLLSGLVGGLRRPWSVHRNYGLPAWADRNTWVILSSYSGDTEETLSAYRDASDRETPILGLTSGGELLERFRQEGLAHLILPGGLPPRFTLGYSLGALARIAVRWGAAPEATALDLEAAAGRLDERATGFGPETPSERNLAKQLALKLHGRIPLVWGTAGRLGAMASRWAAQVCENADQLAFSASLPEADHNLVMGWDHPPGINDRMAAVFLEDPEDPPLLIRRIRVTQELIEERRVPTVTVEGQGQNRVERFCSLLQLVDFTSIYLAVLNGVDPSEIDSIDRLKRRLKRD